MVLTMNKFYSLTYVEETKIGFAFLRTHTWQHHVLRVAIEDLKTLFPEHPPQDPILLDVGCGQGKSFKYLITSFQPKKIIGIDADPLSVKLSRLEAKKNNIDAEIVGADCANIPLEDNSVDIIFCHQTFHHLVEQELGLKEFYRVLKPGGYLLFAESTKYYIDTWIIRLFFRHPMHVQKSAKEYLAMLSDQGFVFDHTNVSYPYLWWSRARDFGLLERLGLRKPSVIGQRNETLVNAVVKKPLQS